VTTVYIDYVRRSRSSSCRLLCPINCQTYITLHYITLHYNVLSGGNKLCLLSYTKYCECPYSCRSGPAVSQFTMVSPVIVGGLGPQLTTHNAAQSSLCSHRLPLDADEYSWRRVRTVHVAAKMDFKFDGNQTRKFDVVLRKIVGANVHRRTVCSYDVRHHMRPSSRRPHYALYPVRPVCLL